MRRAIILLPEAVTDVADAYAWYEEENPGLGEDFLNCLQDAYALIAEHPLLETLVFENRELLLARYHEFHRR